MQILDDGEDLGVHGHKFHQIHSFASIHLFEVDVEDFGKGSQDDIHLLLVQDFKRLLILELKSSFIFQQQGWKRKEVNQVRDQYENWVKSDCQN
jgi:hypothetical protein